jgi:nicotinamide-nucleotide amidase
LPRIHKEFQLPFISHKTIMTYGQGESIIAERIEDFENALPKHIKLAYLPSFGKVRLRLSGKGNDKDTLEKELQDKVSEIQHLISDVIVGLEDGSSIEKRVGELLTEQQKTLATAESLTGGSIATSLVSVPGASAYFKGSFVVYSAEAKKRMLGVSEDIIKTFTLVSKEVAEEMAIAAREKLNTDYAIAVTGNAGPTTDETDKTVGVVFIALATKTTVIVEEFNFGQPREKVINRTVNKSLEILQKEIIKNS